MRLGRWFIQDAEKYKPEDGPFCVVEGIIFSRKVKELNQSKIAHFCQFGSFLPNVSSRGLTREVFVRLPKIWPRQSSTH
jgi:hypothetical protein